MSRYTEDAEYRERHKARQNKKYKEDPEWREKHKASRRAYYHEKKDQLLQRKYGMPITFSAMLQEQEGLCKICKRPMSEVYRGACVDHDHETGKVRGLLCNRCNTGLGYFNDSSELLVAASEYLR